MIDNPIIVALDVESADQARGLVRTLGDSATFYKVGMELYAAAGMDFVRELIGEGKRVFLDLKFFDIPETVKRAVAQVAKNGVSLLTVHAQTAVMKAAAEGRAGSQLKILGVTVLTSMDESDLAADGYRNVTVADLVGRRARNGVAAGVDGFVCSPLEVRTVRHIAGPDRILVTPGVRPSGAPAADQKRVATPADAIRDGANYLVIGRPITRAADPRSAISSILNEIATIR